MSLTYTIAYARKTANNTFSQGIRHAMFAAPQEPLVGPNRPSEGPISDRIGGGRQMKSVESGCASRGDSTNASLLSHLLSKSPNPAVAA